MIDLKRIIPLAILAVAAIAVSCSTVKDQVLSDIQIQDQKNLLEQYVGRSAWTRIILEDLGEAGALPRDTKVKIVDLDFHFTGSVTVETPKKRKRYVYGMEIERPMDVEKVQEKMDDTFWFKDPVLRQVDYIRSWGKKAARAIRAHEVFIGMPSAAALESWGVPNEVNANEIGGKLNEQWVYRVGKRSKYIYIIDGKVSKWED